MESNFFQNRKDVDPNITNSWKMILTKSEIKQCVELLAKQLRFDFCFSSSKIVMVCVLKGAIHFFSDLTKLMDIPFTTHFIEASSYKDQQTQSDKVSTNSTLNPDQFKDCFVIIVDELFDNGKTLYTIKQKFIDEAKVLPNSIFTCVLMKKSKSHDSKYDPPNYCAVSLPDVWLVGYGLDSNGEKRNWNSVFATPKCSGVETTNDDRLLFESNDKDDNYLTMRSNIIEQIHKLNLSLIHY